MNIRCRFSLSINLILGLFVVFMIGCGEEEEEVLVVECEPLSCEELGFACGMETDNCGDPIECPACDVGHDCQQNQCIELSLTERLQAIPGLTIEEIESHAPDARAFVLRLEQPEDHNEPEGTKFEHRMILIHRDVDAPMVLHTLGYGLGLYGPDLSAGTEHLTEPTELLDGNELLVEHRFFGESIADAPDWSRLNIWQSANDSHRIREAFSDIYRQPWIGTGVSKGGMTAIFHHRFFPDDMDGIAPYVAPVTFGFDDHRYQDNIEMVGPADGACRERVEDMAREFIERRDEAADYVEDEVWQASSVDRDTLEVLVASYAVHYHVGFWQSWGSSYVCQHLPPRDVPMEDLAAWVIPQPEAVLQQAGFEPTVGPYRYQVANELGEPLYSTAHVDDLLEEIDFTLIEQWGAADMPWGQSPSFDAEAMLDIDEFLRSGESRVLAIYGQWDPWTGGMINLNENTDNQLYVAPGLNHSATFADLPAGERGEAVDLLMKWAHPNDQAHQALVAANARRVPDWDVEGHRRLADKIAELEVQRALD